MWLPPSQDKSATKRPHMAPSLDRCAQIVQRIGVSTTRSQKMTDFTTLTTAPLKNVRIGGQIVLNFFRTLSDVHRFSPPNSELLHQCGAVPSAVLVTVAQSRRCLLKSRSDARVEQVLKIGFHSAPNSTFDTEVTISKVCRALPTNPPRNRAAATESNRELQTLTADRCESAIGLEEAVPELRQSQVSDGMEYIQYVACD
jgi:hypothetical protein